LWVVSSSWEVSRISNGLIFLVHEFIEIIGDTIIFFVRDTDIWIRESSFEVGSEISSDVFRDHMLSFSRGFVFFSTSPDIRVNLFIGEGISGIEEEPFRVFGVLDKVKV